MRKFALSLVVAVVAVVTVHAGISELRMAFQTPPSSARPHVWWHWMGSNVSRAGITRDLEAMAESGIGGVTIFNVTSHAKCGPQMENAFNPALSYRNAEYWELLKFAAAEAKRLGLELSLHNCPGFSASGGPWVTADESMKTLTWSVADDPSSLAEPEWNLMHGPVGTFAVTNADGRVKWYRLDWTATARQTSPAPDELLGRTLEADKLSASSVRHHLDNVLIPIREHLGEPAQAGLTGITMDSYEAGKCNWTEGILESFNRRRGYDPRPFLVVLAGAELKDGERFLEDWQKTVEELFLENHHMQFAERLHAEGLKFHLEPYGGPFDEWETAALADYPMVEFWLVHPPAIKKTLGGFPSVAGAVARALGKTVIGAEAFTSFPLRGGSDWSVAPRHLKCAGDATYARGINRMILHHWVHQPFPSVWQPGMTFGHWGTQFGENQTWHVLGKAYFLYLARCQALLQRGTETIDRLVLCGRPKEGERFDAVPESVFANGLEVLPGGDVRIRSSGRRYRLLEIPQEMTAPSLVVARTVKRLVDAGAHVRAPRFARARGLSGYPHCDEEISTLSRSLEGKCDWTLDGLGVRPLVEIQSAHRPCDVLWTGRTDKGTDFYFICNTTSNSLPVCALFRSAGKSPSVWRPATGEIGAARSWHETRDGRTQVEFTLEPSESVFVVFDGAFVHPENSVSNREIVTVLDYSDFWMLSFEKNKGAPADEVPFDGLESLSVSPCPGIRYFSGTVTYRKHLDVWETLKIVQAEGARRYELDLGDVRDICSVKIGDVDCGVLWYPPYRLDVTDVIRRLVDGFVFDDSKTNTLDIEIQVVNTWHNRLVGDHLEPEDCRWHAPTRFGRALRELPSFVFSAGPRPSSGRVGFVTWDSFGVNTPLIPSGLIGPVRLKCKK